MMIGVSILRGYLLELGRLTKEKLFPRKQLTVQRPELAYLMGDASGAGFGSMLWCHGRMIS